jgi:hypothetical protein
MRTQSQKISKSERGRNAFKMPYQNSFGMLFSEAFWHLTPVSHQTRGAQRAVL